MAAALLPRRPLTFSASSSGSGELSLAAAGALAEDLAGALAEVMALPLPRGFFASTSSSSSGMGVTFRLLRPLLGGIWRSSGKFAASAFAPLLVDATEPTGSTLRDRRFVARGFVGAAVCGMSSSVLEAIGFLAPFPLAIFFFELPLADETGAGSSDRAFRNVRVFFLMAPVSLVAASSSGFERVSESALSERVDFDVAPSRAFLGNF